MGGMYLCLGNGKWQKLLFRYEQITHQWCLTLTLTYYPICHTQFPIFPVYRVYMIIIIIIFIDKVQVIIIMVKLNIAMYSVIRAESAMTIRPLQYAL